MNDNQSPLTGLLLILVLVLALGNPQGCQPIKPVEPEVLAGPRTILLVREASKVTPKMAMAEVQLRVGPAADYLKSKSHRLWILSDDQNPPASLGPKAKEGFEKAKQAVASNEATPVLAIAVESSSGSSGELAVEPVSRDMTIDEFLSVLKKHGG